MSDENKYFGIEKLIFKLASADVVSNMKFLYGETQYVERIYSYYKKKIAIVLGVAGAIALVYINYNSMSNNENQLLEDKKITRNSYGENKKQVKLIAYNNDISYSNEITFDISEKRYSDDEIEYIAKNIQNEFPAAILNYDDTADHVTNDLSYVDYIDKYPFSISYSTDNPELIDQNGKINKEKLRKYDKDGMGVLIMVTINLSYFDFEEDFFTYIKIYATEQSFDEKLSEAILEKINQNDEEYVTYDYILLPDEVGGLKISYSEQLGKTFLILFFIFGIVSIIIHKGLDNDLVKKREKLTMEMMREYPTLVSKFALYHNAGMSVKNIWNRVCMEYINDINTTHKCKEIYERMLVCNNSMSDGKGEIEAYLAFADDIGLKKYRFFISLLCQTITKGKSNVSVILTNESMDAFELKKNNALKRAEEASTKLILPMILMLLVVIVMVVYPAFSSFKY